MRNTGFEGTEWSPDGRRLSYALTHHVAGGIERAIAYSGAGVAGTIPTSGLSRVRGEPNRREPIIRESPLVPRDVSPGIVLVATTDA
jgi:hypothetical protein